MFRNAHFLPTSPGKFDSSMQLTKAEFRFFPLGTLIVIRWRKTIQFRERVVEIPLPCIPRGKLCPTAAILHAFSFTPPAADSQAFNWVEAPTSKPRVFTYNQFLCKLRDHLALIGNNPTLYAGTLFVEARYPLLTSPAFS